MMGSITQARKVLEEVLKRDPDNEHGRKLSERMTTQY